MRFLIRKVAKCLFVSFGIAYRLVIKKRNTLTILMYHRVNDHIGMELSVKEDCFRWQMDYLLKKGYRIISMDEAIKGLKEKSLLQKSVVITFDDGYEDFYLQAYPVLAKYDIPALMYLVPGYIDAGKTYWWDQVIGKSQLMSWEQIKEISRQSNISFGSHTLNHMDLNAIDEEEIEFELLQSKMILKKQLGIEAKHFAYPRGIYACAAERFARRLYNSAVLIMPLDKGDVKNRTNLFTLSRMPVQRSDGKLLFVARLKGWLVIEDWIRLILKR